ncbi:iron-containing alcohol dehydrogenase family protein [Bacillus velezensis]|uniref:iron-containing alcohol dehydrogenase family protein n=1 Tax=Bacillus amyloliquefaciens group TaxID=1938374 RepID=UPI0013623CE3|nr:MULTISPECIES: iron-containing alcohol dehydrogenase family protein [Bacillus amyloliquefaciens group]MDH3120984.1 iron-containing alcohol dehydrogenase family protein [Bacillus velezensis]NHN19683.1 iron-containing alcohol dehydrogenase family protein [Bacillus amyloliquefaciens]NRG13980.1 iron-containing alcohol dehydrogenase family protein [Bacillus velezensis]NRR85490.1 iron-containing alcohol dehydrogenase family protein [Bacillus velezensis]NRS10154.1 iron-containing alcohol dehydrogen
MKPEDIVRSGPNQYICKEGIAKELPGLLETFRKPVIVAGIKSYQAFSDYSGGSSWDVIQHKGYCSPEAVRKVCEQAEDADVIIGIGGGTILDLAKAAADRLDIEAVMVPSIAGTCAASTPLSVMYDESGNFIRVDYHKRSSYLTLVDPLFLLSSPIEYMKSGIGDTLAKWYEAEAVIRNTEEAAPLMAQAGLRQAEYIRNLLLRYSEAAVGSMEKGELSVPFIHTAETIIMLAGTVGGYGGRLCRMAGAHAVHNGLSFLQETHQVLHGQKVAYGILVQLALENRRPEIEELLPFYRRLGFPVSLCDLGILDNHEEAKRRIASHACRAEESLCLMGQYREKDVSAAIESLESAQKTG